MTAVDRLNGATVDPASVASGAQSATGTVTVTGAALGDLVSASFSLDLQGMDLCAYVSAADFFRNGTAGAVDLGSGTLKIRVIKDS